MGAVDFTVDAYRGEIIRSQAFYARDGHSGRAAQEMRQVPVMPPLDEITRPGQVELNDPRIFCPKKSIRHTHAQQIRWGIKITL